MAEAPTMTTNLPVPIDLRDRVVASAERNHRTYKLQLIALIEKALDQEERQVRK